MQTFELKDNIWYELINFEMPDNLKNIDPDNLTESEINQISVILDENKPITVTDNLIISKLNGLYDKYKPENEHRVINMNVSLDLKNKLQNGILNCFVDDKQVQIRF